MGAQPTLAHWAQQKYGGGGNVTAGAPASQRQRTEAQKAVVDRLEADLGADIADLDTRERAVVLQVADLHEERVRTEVLAVEEEPRHQDDKVARLSQAAVRRGASLQAEKGAARRQAASPERQVATSPTYPGHHLSDVTVGLWMMNSCDALS